MRICSILLVLYADIAGAFQSASVATKTTSTQLGVTIFGHPGTRSPLVNWACLEAGVQFDMGDLGQNPHPFGQIPCLSDDDNVVVFESGAILLYLHGKYCKMSPAASAVVQSWIVWANASLDPICFLETPDGKVYDTGLKKPNRRLDRLEEILKSNESGGSLVLVPEAGFSLADVAVASYLLYVPQFFPNVLDESPMVSKWPTILRYMKESASRDAYAEAFGPGTQGSLVQLLSAEPSPKKLFGMF